MVFKVVDSRQWVHGSVWKNNFFLILRINIGLPTLYVQNKFKTSTTTTIYSPHPSSHPHYNQWRIDTEIQMRTQNHFVTGLVKCQVLHRVIGCLRKLNKGMLAGISGGVGFSNHAWRQSEQRSVSGKVTPLPRGAGPVLPTPVLVAASGGWEVGSSATAPEDSEAGQNRMLR